MVRFSFRYLSLLLVLLYFFGKYRRSWISEAIYESAGPLSLSNALCKLLFGHLPCSFTGLFAWKDSEKYLPPGLDQSSPQRAQTHLSNKFYHITSYSHNISEKKSISLWFIGCVGSPALAFATTRKKLLLVLDRIMIYFGFEFVSKL